MAFKLIVNNKTYQYDNYIENISKKDAIFALANKLDQYELFINDKSIQIENIFHLKVNVNHIGEFHFYLNKDNINEQLLNSIKELKDIDSSNYDNALIKLNKLLDILTDLELYFVIYHKYDDAHDVDNVLVNRFNNLNINLFIVKEAIGEISPDDGKFINLLKANKFRWILTIFAPILTTIISSLSFLYIFNQNNIGVGIFLLVIAILGYIAMFIANNDLFKSNKTFIKKEIYIYSGLTLIGIIIGVGLYIGIHFLIKTEVEILSLPILSLIGFGFSIIGLILTLAINFLILKIKKNKK